MKRSTVSLLWTVGLFKVCSSGFRGLLGLFEGLHYGILWQYIKFDAVGQIHGFATLNYYTYKAKTEHRSPITNTIPNGR